MSGCVALQVPSALLCWDLCPLRLGKQEVLLAFLSAWIRMPLLQCEQVRNERILVRVHVKARCVYRTGTAATCAIPLLEALAASTPRLPEGLLAGPWAEIMKSNACQTSILFRFCERVRGIIDIFFPPQGVG